MKNLRTIILAAGKGTRMKSATPKILHAVCGKTLLAYILDLAKAVGSLKTYIILGHHSDAINGELDPSVTPVLQSKLLGTADAVKSAQNYFRSYKGDVLILCGDTPLLKRDTIKSLVRKHKKADAACTFLTAVVRDSRGYGRIIRGPNGAAVAIREEGDATEYEKNIVEINAGVYCFKSSVLFNVLKEVKANKKKKEFYLTDIVEILTEQGQRVETLETADANEGLGVNTREDLALAESVIRLRILKEFMAQGVTIIDPQTTYIQADVKIGRDTLIRPFTIIENNVRIGTKCCIGPFTHVRPGSRIGNQVELGNFVEVSRTQIGEKSIMKHFSFLGDANVGAGVNIGAGVVTANYDGKEKNKTRIMDYAFIGSDSILVAPIKVGRRAMTGAGCVVTRGKIIPDKGVAVGVPAKILDKKK